MDGPLGVVMATSGGGALNVVPALGEAYASCVPILALVGQPPPSLEGRGAFQDGSGHGASIDARALFATVAVYCRRVMRADDVPGALDDALAAALGGRLGPAVLLLPKDVQRAQLDRLASEAAALPAAGRAPAPDCTQAAAAPAVATGRSLTE